MVPFSVNRHTSPQLGDVPLGGLSLSACQLEIPLVYGAHRLAVIKEIITARFVRSVLFFDITTTDTLFTADNGQEQLRQQS